MEDHDGLKKKLSKNGFHEYDENPPDVLYLLETLEENEGYLNWLLYTISS
jgi:hypothetical protein